MDSSNTKTNTNPAAVTLMVLSGIVSAFSGLDYFLYKYHCYASDNRTSEGKANRKHYIIFCTLISSVLSMIGVYYIVLFKDSYSQDAYNSSLVSGVFSSLALTFHFLIELSWRYRLCCFAGDRRTKEVKSYKVFAAYFLAGIGFILSIVSAVFSNNINQLQRNRLRH